MKAYHVLSLAGAIALSGVLLAQATTSGSTQTSTSSSSSSSKSAHGSSSSSGQTSRDGSQSGLISMNGKKVFAVLCSPGENWKPDHSVGQQDLGEHVAYLEELKARNILVMAGPFMDNSGGEYVIVAKDLKEAQAIVAQDPGYRSKVLAPSVHEWYVAVKSPQVMMSLLGHNAGQGGSSSRNGG